MALSSRHRSYLEEDGSGSTTMDVTQNGTYQQPEAQDNLGRTVISYSETAQESSSPESLVATKIHREQIVQRSIIISNCPMNPKSGCTKVVDWAIPLAPTQVYFGNT